MRLWQIMTGRYKWSLRGTLNKDRAGQGIAAYWGSYLSPQNNITDPHSCIQLMYLSFLSPCYSITLF